MQETLWALPAPTIHRCVPLLWPAARSHRCSALATAQSTQDEYDAQAQDYKNVSYNMHNEVEFASFFLHCGDLTGESVSP